MSADSRSSCGKQAWGHSYYQGLLLELGRLLGFQCWAPNQDRRKPFLQRTLGEVRTLQQLPAFAHPQLVKRSETVDAIWFNERQMPSGFFEVEHTTDIQNSLIKFADLQDFAARMVIVSSEVRKSQFQQQLNRAAFRGIRSRVEFFDYDWLVKSYEHESAAAGRPRF